MSKAKDIVWQFTKPVPSFVEWSRLKKARQSQGLTLSDLAIAAGLASPNTIVLHERGFMGRPETRKAICKALGFEESEIYPVRVLGDTVIETSERLRIEITEE